MTMNRLGRDTVVPALGPVSKDRVKPAIQHGHDQSHHGHHGRDLAETPPGLRLAIADLAGQPGPGPLADSELGHPLQNEPSAHEVHRLGAPSPSSDIGKAASFAGVFGQDVAGSFKIRICFGYYTTPDSECI